MAIEDAVILEKDLARMKPKDVVAELKKQGLPLLTEDLPLLQTKLAVPSKGLELSTDRPVLVHRAIEVGVMTDGFLLVENKEAVEQVVGKFLENEKRKEVRKLIRLKSFPSEVEAREHIDALFDRYSKEGTFPNHKALYPEEVGKELKLVGVYAGTEDEPLTAGSSDVYAYLSEGSIIIPVDANKLAFILKYLPDAKMFPAMRQGKVSNTSPVVFQVKGKEKGLLMPLSLQGFPDAIEAKALKTTPKIDPSEEKGIAPAISAKIAPAKPEKSKAKKPFIYSTGGVGPRFWVKAGEPAFPLHPKSFATKAEAEKFLAELKPPAVEKAKAEVKPTFKMGDRVMYKGEEWEVGFVNQLKFKGTLRLQKSGRADAKQVNYIYPEDVKRVKISKPTHSLTELRDIHSERTPLSRASDERQSHQVTISPDNPKAKAWIKDPGTADIEGIDTPPIGKRTPKISRRTPRITPKAGRLK